MTQLAARPTRFPRPIAADQKMASDTHLTRNVLIFLLLHIPLAFAMQATSFVASLHAYAAMLAGIIFLVRDKDTIRILYLVAYAVGAEVLWRATGANIFWEIGKYSIIGFLLIAMLKERNFANYDIIPFFYFLLLLPAIINFIDWGAFSPEVASELNFFELIFYRLGVDRENLAFHLAGPLALTVGASYFASKRLTLAQLRNIFLAFLGPAVGLLALAVIGTLQADSEVLGNLYTSSRLTSAGTGPNQVSSALGLAATIAFFLIFVIEKNSILKLVAAVLVVGMLGQAMLTLSRGGVYNAVLAMFFGGVVLIRERRARLVLIVSGAAFVLITLFIIVPTLDSLTGGGLRGRFASQDDSGRSDISAAQIEAFSDSPIFGQGVDQVTVRGHGSHNEYTRTLAEHGLVGATGLLIIIFVSAKKLISDLSPLQLAFSTIFFSWAFLYIAYTGTRLAAPAFAFGLATATLILNQPDSVEETTDLKLINPYGQTRWASDPVK